MVILEQLAYYTSPLRLCDGGFFFFFCTELDLLWISITKGFMDDSIMILVYVGFKHELSTCEMFLSYCLLRSKCLYDKKTSKIGN